MKQDLYFIDSHTHLYCPAFDEDLDTVISRCIENGVTKMILPNEDSKSIPAMVKTLARYPGICYGAMGLHPTSVDENCNEELKLVKDELFNGNVKYVAVGEIGLDFYWDITYSKLQEEVFRTQLRWSQELNLPVIIHSRKAESRVLDILEEDEFANAFGILHCWSGNEEETLRAVKLDNFYFGIGGTVTYKNSQIPKLLTVIGLDRVVMETDSPYLTPVPFRGKRNESSYIPLIANVLSSIFDVGIEKISEVTNFNNKKIFSL